MPAGSSRKLANLGPFAWAKITLLGMLMGLPVAARPLQGGSADLVTQARAFEDEKNYPAAEEVYRKLLASDSNNPEVLKHLGILEQTDLKFDDSIKHFKRALAGRPDYPQVNFYLGLSYYGKHDLSDALTRIQLLGTILL